jgi:hypothetical protein
LRDINSGLFSLKKTTPEKAGARAVAGAGAKTETSAPTLQSMLIAGADRFPPEDEYEEHHHDDVGGGPPPRPRPPLPAQVLTNLPRPQLPAQVLTNLEALLKATYSALTSLPRSDQEALKTKRNLTPGKVQDLIDGKIEHINDMSAESKAELFAWITGYIHEQHAVPSTVEKPKYWKTLYDALKKVNDRFPSNLFAARFAPDLQRFYLAFFTAQPDVRALLRDALAGASVRAGAGAPPGGGRASMSYRRRKSFLV